MSEPQKISVPVKLYNNFLNELINQIFKILPIYEDCIKSKDKSLTPYLVHLDNVVTQILGANYFFYDNTFFSVATILKGLQEINSPSQKKVKSIVFCCIDKLSKLKRDEVEENVLL